MIFSAKGLSWLSLKRAILDEPNIHAEQDFALRCAAKGGFLDIVKLLFDCGANINANQDETLVQAANRNQLSIVRFLLENGADIHAQNDTIILDASKTGNISLMRVLLENGADIHTQYDESLKQAKKYSNVDMVIFLTKYINNKRDPYKKPNQCVAISEKGIRCKNAFIPRSSYCKRHKQI